ncbi:OmpA family protein [Flavobacterium sp. H122]|uniref:OmpA family protein n=1 Tax=Flavobacterium sp. H122 TaxID=2529860 RepID=UPI00145B067B|nr:OmpA family protein [Flavobacterium sp. H122]
MSVNLLDSLKEYITPELLSQASGALGESESGVSNAISSALPTLLGGLLNKSGDSNAMGSVMDLITKSSADSGGILSNLGGLLSGGNSEASGIGSSLLSLLFGGKLSSITDLIAGVSGIKSSSAGSILGMAAPLLLGHLGKSGITLSGLTGLLSSQKESILAAAPAGLGSVLGFSGISGGSFGSASGGTTDGHSGDSGFPKWLIPLLLIGAALLALYYFTKGCNKSDMESSDVSVEAVDSLVGKASSEMDSATSGAVDAMGDAASALGNFFKFKLPNGVELNAPEKGIENQLVTWLNDKSKVVDKTTWFNFDRLLFETGKSTLKPESQEQLKNIAEVLKAYPSVEIKLGGYTDNVGDPKANLKLSGDRASSVMNELVKLGIDAKRIVAEGYGDQHPVASNDTEEGRAQNRRIAIRVTKK